MPETETPESGAMPDAGATPAGEETPGTDNGATPDLGDAGKKAIDELRREVKTIRQERDELARVVKERDDAGKTELERLTAERDELRARVDELERGATERDRADRARAAATDAGIPEFWDRLRGETEEELKADAKAMAERFGVTSSPTRDLGAGARPAPSKGAGMNERIRASRGRRS